MTTRTPAHLKAFAMAHKPMAETVCKAKAFATLERQRVDAYVLPIFETFRFVDENGAAITKPGDLYLCTDEATSKEFHHQCRAAHRAHGWTGPQERCPALTAEYLQIDAENALLEAGCKFLEVDPWMLDSDDRKKLSELLLAACLHR